MQNRSDWCIARGRKTKVNGANFYKGVINSGGKSFSVVVWPVNGGEDVKVELWPWSGMRSISNNLRRR